MPHRKNASPNSVKNQSELSEDLEETPVYIIAPRYGAIKHKISQPTFYHEPHLIKINEITPGITRNEYESRRKRLFRKIPLDSCLILASNPESKFSSDGRYAYRQQSDFNYFTGLQESDTIAIFTKDAAGNCKFLLFLQPIIKHEMCWHGHRCGLNAAIKYFGAHESFSIGGADKKLYEIMDTHDRIYFDEFVNEEIAEEIKELMQKECKKKIRLLKPRKIMQQIRLIKSTAEVALIRASVEISALSMIDTMQFCEAGMLENELSVQFEHGCKIRGAARLSYECSVASGLNAVNLTYFNNNSLLNDGDLCLIDCGCEYNGYSSDITRTFPVNGVFTTAQCEVYEMVLNVSNALIGMMKIGCTIKKLESQTAKLIKKGLKELGVTSKMQNHQIKELKVSCADVHFVAHFIGLDIHDTSDITHSKEFEANMILAVEPAVYLPDHALIPPKYRGIGIRIEDDVLITMDGAEILSKALPRSVQEIESYMKGKSMFPRIRPLNLLCEEGENKNNNNEIYSHSGDLILSSGDISAAKTLSCIRFAAKKEEKIKQEAVRRQYDAVKLFQQAIYEYEQQESQSQPYKRHKSSNAGTGCIDANDSIRRTRSGKGYRNVIKSHKLQSQSEKKKKKRNGTRTGTQNGRIPKLSNTKNIKYNINTNANANANTNANTITSSFYKSTKSTKSANIESHSKPTSKSKPKSKSKSITNIKPPTSLNTYATKPITTKFKRINACTVTDNNNIIISKHFDDVDSNSTNSSNSSNSYNSIISSDTCNLSIAKSSHSTLDTLVSNKKKKKSLYSSPTSPQIICTSRKRKRDEIERIPNNKRHTHTPSQSQSQYYKIDRKNREREPPIKRNKLNNYHTQNSSNSCSSIGNNNNSYRYQYKYNDCYSYYNDDYKYHNKPNPTPYYCNDMLYAAFYPPYVVNQVNQHSSNSNTSSNTQSAYDSFMAKSNDKNNT